MSSGIDAGDASMTLRNESKSIGYALATMGVAFAGSMAALLTLPLVGYYSGLPPLLIAAYTGLVPAIAIALFTSLSPHLSKGPAHPVPATVAAFVAGTLAFPLFYPFGVFSLMFLAALVVYAVAELSRFALDRPALAGKDIALHGAVALLVYGFFAERYAATALHWVDTTGCEECVTTESLVSALALFTLALAIVLGATLRYRPPARRRRSPSLTGGALP